MEIEDKSERPLDRRAQAFAEFEEMGVPAVQATLETDGFKGPAQFMRGFPSSNQTERFATEWLALKQHEVEQAQAELARRNIEAAELSARSTADSAKWAQQSAVAATESAKWAKWAVIMALVALAYPVWKEIVLPLLGK